MNESSLKESANRNEQQHYLDILSLGKVPESPEDFPLTIELPQKLSQVLHEIREETAKSNDEAGVVVFADGNKFNYEFVDGNQGQVGQPYKELGRIFFGKKPCMDYHAHRAGGNPFLSLRDMSIFSSTPRGAYMYGVGTDIGYWLLAQSEKAMKIPISYYGKRFLSSFIIQERIAGESKRSREEGTSPDEKNIRMIESTIHSLENFGLAVYFSPLSRDMSQPTTQSIKLARFKPEDVQGRLTPEQRQSIFS